MAEYITKKIPVSNHVYKYLIYLYGNTYTYNRRDCMGMIISGVVKKGFRFHKRFTLDKTFTFKFKKEHARLLGQDIDWETCIYFNQAIDDVFKKSLFFHIDMERKLNNGNAYRAMVESLAEMNIEDTDINYESLYKRYRMNCRFKKTNKIEIEF